MTNALYMPTPSPTPSEESPRSISWNALWSTLKVWRLSLQRRWTDAAQVTRTRIQVSVLIGAVLVAYNYSLSTLLQTVDQQTPLAYISLVPAIALALAAIRSRPLKPEPPINDRQVDYIIGIPLIAVAIAINQLLPGRLSAMFWVYRVDLLSLPIFVAGAVAIIFGTRVLWRQKLAIAFLFLAWPYPYEKYLLGVLNGFTDLTLLAMVKIATWTHLAAPQSSVGETLFIISHHGTPFTLSIVSACSGVNGVVGFLLVGSAFAAIVRGPIVRKVLWLLGGMALLWLLNLGRITFIFFAGREWGESIALNVFHPFVGLLLFIVGLIVMLLLIRPLGMHIAIGERDSSTSSDSTTIPDPPVDAHMAPRRGKATLAVPKVFLAIAAVVVAALVMGVNNVGLNRYDLVAGVAGQAKLDAYVNGPVSPNGWLTTYENTFTWAKPLFGDASIWNRYVMRATGIGPLHTSAPVVADVINTPDLSSFSAFGVENCYTFHGYSLADVTNVSLVGGISGQAMSYTSPQFGSWSIVYWIAPVKMATGSTNYERTVLYVRNAGQGVLIKGLTTPASLSNIGGTLDAANQADRRLINNRTFLVAFADQLISSEASRAKVVNANATSGVEGVSTS